MLPRKVKKYDDGRTKQAFKAETDINKILARAQKTGTISHLAKHQAKYGDFADFDFFEATQQLTRGREIFDELPSEIRQEFGQSPAEFFKFVNDPANRDRLDTIMPVLAKPGRQNIDVRGNRPADVVRATQEPENPNPGDKAEPPPEKAPEPAQGDT